MYVHCIYTALRSDERIIVIPERRREPVLANNAKLAPNYPFSRYVDDVCLMMDTKTRAPDQHLTFFFCVQTAALIVDNADVLLMETDLIWSSVEKSENVWFWDDVDEYLDFCEKNGLEPIGMCALRIVICCLRRAYFEVGR